MKLILLSPPTDTSGELSMLCSMLESGLELYHIRKPGFDRKEMRDHLKKIPSGFHDRLVLHSHHELAAEFGLRKLHFNAAAPFPAALPQGFSFSKSRHSLDEIKQTAFPLSYVFLSPVFDSISKTGYRAAFNEADLKTFLAVQHPPFEVIALGGITPANIIEAAKLGFDGAAALGSVWMAADPVSAFQELQEICISQKIR